MRRSSVAKADLVALEMAKSIDDNFSDWWSNTFRFGYGTGEQYTLPALRVFLEACDGQNDQYQFQEMEGALGPLAAWLMIDAMCRVDAVEYGTSPRYGWLTPEGKSLRAFIRSKTDDELSVLTARDETYIFCAPDYCNCGPDGYEKGRVCDNPFWPRSHSK